MKIKIFLAILLLGLPIVLSLVVGQNDLKIPAEPPIYTPPTQTSSGANDFLFLSLFVLSLIVGVTLTIFMIKKSSRTLNLLIQGLIVLITVGVIIWSISISGLKYLLSSDLFQMSLFAIPLLLLSTYFLINLIKKKGFEKTEKYGLNLSSGMILTTILVVFSSAITELIYPPTGFGGLVALIMLIAGVILSFVVGIVGVIIDKLKAK